MPYEYDTPSEAVASQTSTAKSNEVQSGPEIFAGESLKELKNARFAAAEIAADQALLGCVAGIGKFDPKQTKLSNIPLNLSDGYFLGGVDYQALMELRSLETEPQQIVKSLMTSEDGAQILDKQIGENELRVRKTGRAGLMFELSGPPASDNPWEATPPEISKKAAETFSQNQNYQAIRNLVQSLENTHPDSQMVRTGELSLTQDPLGTCALLQELGFFYGRPNPDIVFGNKSILEAIDDLAVEIISRVDTPDMIQFSRKDDGVVKVLTINKQTNTYSVSFEKDLQFFYSEIANQSSEEIPPFIDTRCAAEMLSLLDSHGLKFSYEIEDEITRIGDADRYGSVYTQLSREVAKWVNRSERVQPNKLFKENTSSDADSGHDGNDPNLTLTEKLMAIDASHASMPTKIFFSLVQSCLRREQSYASEREGGSQLPITPEDVHMKAGACFDVAGYYLSASEEGRGLAPYQEQGIRMLEKTLGSHTFLLLDPVMLNRVELPPGALLLKGSNNSWAFLRLTPFCFDNEEDIQATGSEMAKAITVAKVEPKYYRDYSLARLAKWVIPKEGQRYSQQDLD